MLLSISPSVRQNVSDSGCLANADDLSRPHEGIEQGDRFVVADAQESPRFPISYRAIGPYVVDHLTLGGRVLDVRKPHIKNLFCS